jgi:hypothetical protein
MSKTLEPMATEVDQKQLAEQLLAQAKEQGVELVGRASRQMGRSLRHHRHRGPMGPGSAAAPRRNDQTRRPPSPACSYCSTPNGRPRSAA